MDENLRAVPLVYLGQCFALMPRSGVHAGAGVQAPGKKAARGLARHPCLTSSTEQHRELTFCPSYSEGFAV